MRRSLHGRVKQLLGIMSKSGIFSRSEWSIARFLRNTKMKYSGYTTLPSYKQWFDVLLTPHTEQYTCYSFYWCWPFWWECDEISKWFLFEFSWWLRILSIYLSASKLLKFPLLKIFCLDLCHNFIIWDLFFLDVHLFISLY